MLTIASEVILNQYTAVWVKGDGAGVRDPNPSISIMRGGKRQGVTDELLHDGTNLGVIGDREESARSGGEPVLLFTVDHDGVMSCGGAQTIPAIGVARVAICSGVG